MIKDIARQARQASVTMASLSTEIKDNALAAVAQALAAAQNDIIKANQKDMAKADQEGISEVLIKRLKFDATKLQSVIDGINSVISLPDPAGQTLHGVELDTNLELRQVSCPIGVLGIVFESRPDALVQISALAIKSGNAILLKGGSEAAGSNKILADIISTAGIQAGLPQGWLGLMETRDDVTAMLDLDQYIDLIIPRGSNAFVKYIMDNTRIPVLGHADGICHVYIDAKADLTKALPVAFDSKCQYAAVCNAMETLLVDETIAAEFLPLMKVEYDKAKVELRGDQKTQAIIDCKPATSKDWATEYNDMILSIKIVNNLPEAIDHINQYGSGHTDAIVTEDPKAAQSFMALVDSGNTFWNCSTRFADGFRYGLGAEVGISTNKIHARGPVGLEGLMIYKWQLTGTGQIVADYAGENGKSFTHKPLR